MLQKHKKNLVLKKKFIISTKPFLRNIFFKFQVISKSLIHIKNVVVLKFSTISNLGAFVFFLLLQNVITTDFFLFNLGFLLKQTIFFKFLSKFKCLIKGIRFAWMINFAIEGYHFRAFLTKLRKMRKFVVLFHLGFFYNVLLFFPGTVKLYWKKRTFKMRGALLTELILIAYYIRMIRNLFPYKIKGFVYDNLLYFKADGYEKELFVIKPGKKGDAKTKHR